MADSLYCPEAFFCSHLDSYSHYLREAGEDAHACLVSPGPWDVVGPDGLAPYRTGWTEYPDVVFVLDGYGRIGTEYPCLRIAQVAAICDPMPWEVRKLDGSPAYDLVLSSIPWMVEEARKHGCRAEYMPLAFDTRARVCGMGVERDLGCIFIGTVGPNHARRTAFLSPPEVSPESLLDVVQVLPPVFGREYFKTLARAKVVFNVHAEWARGAANAMRLWEAAGMGCGLVSDGDFPEDDVPGAPTFWSYESAGSARNAIVCALESENTQAIAEMAQASVLRAGTYESRIPRLIQLAKELMR